MIDPLFLRNAIKIAFLCICLAHAGSALAVTQPTVTPGTGTFSSTQSVSMSADPGASIFFTTNGTQPTSSSTPYTGPVQVATSTQINAIALLGGTYSSVKTVFLDVDPTVGPELVSGLIVRYRGGFGTIVGSGNPPLVSKWTDLSGAGNDATQVPTIPLPNILNNPISFSSVGFHDVQGGLSLPTGFSTFSGATIFMMVQPDVLPIGRGLFALNATSGGNGWTLETDSNGKAQIGIYAYLSPSPNPKALSKSPLVAGRYQLVEAVIASASPNAGTVLIDGIPGAPTSSMLISNGSRSGSLVYPSFSTGSRPFVGRIYEVLVYNTELSLSQRAAIRTLLLSKYQPTNQPTAAVFSVPSGSLAKPTLIAITAPRECGLIRYTTDGSDPGPSSPVYGGPVLVSFSQTIKAINVLGASVSPIASATYTLDPNLYPAPNPTDSTPPTVNLTLPTATQ